MVAMASRQLRRGMRLPLMAMDKKVLAGSNSGSSRGGDAKVSSRGLRTVPGQYGINQRQGVSGKRIAVFGGTGMLGRYVLNHLGKVGTLGVVPNRDSDMAVRFLKPNFDLGMFHSPFYSFDDEESVREAIRGCDAVVNCIGKYYETKHLVMTRRNNGKLSNINCTFEEVNVDIPRLIARLAKEEGVPRLVHVSALAQNPDSASRWSRTKAEGEVAVREEYPEAVLVRPAKLFGDEDRYLTWLGDMCTKFAVPLVEGGKALQQPVSAVQVAECIATLVDNPELLDLDGKVCEFAGPETWAWDEAAQFFFEVINHPGRSINLSRSMAEAAGRVFQQFPNPYFTADEAIQMTEDVVLSPSSAAMKMEDLGVVPCKVADKAFGISHKYRPGGSFIDVQGYHDTTNHVH